MEAHLWSSGMCYHYNHFPLTFSTSKNGPSCQTCENSHLTWQTTLIQSQYHFHWCGSWSQFSSNTCWLTSQFPQCMPSGAKFGLGYHHLESTIPWYSHVASCTRDLWVIISSGFMTSVSHTKFLDKVRNLLVLLDFPNKEYGIRSILKRCEWLCLSNRDWSPRHCQGARHLPRFECINMLHSPLDNSWVWSSSYG